MCNQVMKFNNTFVYSISAKLAFAKNALRYGEWENINVQIDVKDF